MREEMSINVRRSALGRARGVGAGQSGVEHWRAERITSIALIPLTLWFVYAMLQMIGAPQEVVAGWAANPINTVLLLTLVVMTFHHMQLGLQVVYEDYVSNKAMLSSLILGTKAVCLLLGLLSGVAVLKLALS